MAFNPFGAATTATNPFGTPTTAAAPAFGAPTTAAANPFAPKAASPFAAPAPATTNPFGTPAASTNIFAAKTTMAPANPFGTATPAAGTNLFAAPAATAANPFATTTPGAANPFATTATATTANLFTTPGTTATAGLSNPFAPTPTPATLPPAGVQGVAATQDPTQKLQALIAAFNPADPRCQFKYMLYNVVNPAELARYQRPANIPDALWNFALQRNPDPATMVPVPATGFTDLTLRLEEHQKRIDIYKQRLQELEAILVRVQQYYALNIRTRLNEYRHRHMEISQLVCQLMKGLEVLQTGKGARLSGFELALRTRLQHIQSKLDRPTKFKAVLNELYPLLQRHVHRAEPVEEIESDDLNQVSQLLGDQLQGVELLARTVRDDLAAVGTIGQTLSHPESLVRTGVLPSAAASAAPVPTSATSAPAAPGISSAPGGYHAPVRLQ